MSGCISDATGAQATASPRDPAKPLAAMPGPQMLVEDAAGQRTLVESDMVISLFLGRRGKTGTPVELVVNDYCGTVRGRIVAADHLTFPQQVGAKLSLGALAVVNLLD